MVVKMPNYELTYENKVIPFVKPDKSDIEKIKELVKSNYFQDVEFKTVSNVIYPQVPVEKRGFKLSFVGVKTHLKHYYFIYNAEDKKKLNVFAVKAETGIFMPMKGVFKLQSYPNVKSPETEKLIEGSEIIQGSEPIKREIKSQNIEKIVEGSGAIKGVRLQENEYNFIVNLKEYQFKLYDNGTARKKFKFQLDKKHKEIIIRIED